MADDLDVFIFTRILIYVIRVDFGNDERIKNRDMARPLFPNFIRECDVGSVVIILLGILNPRLNYKPRNGNA